MEITEPCRLYQQFVVGLRERIEQSVYLIGDKLPTGRFTAGRKNVSRTVVREAIIMLEAKGYIEVRKDSGIHMASNQPRHQQAADNNMEFANYGPLELPQARWLIESDITEFATTQITKQGTTKLMAIQEQTRGEQCFHDSEWDLQFHIQVVLTTQNSALATIVEKMWTQRSHSPYWKKLYEHIGACIIDNWCDDHDQVLKASTHKDSHATKLAMWQHLENTRIMLFNETSDDFEFNADRYLFIENPVVHLDTATNGSKRNSCPTDVTMRLFISSVSEKYKVSAYVNPLTFLPCVQQNQTPRICNFDNKQR